LREGPLSGKEVHGAYIIPALYQVWDRLRQKISSFKNTMDSESRFRRDRNDGLIYGLKTFLKG